MLLRPGEEHAPHAGKMPGSCFANILSLFVCQLFFFWGVNSLFFLVKKYKQALVEMQNLRDAIKIVSQYPVLPLRYVKTKTRGRVLHLCCSGIDIFFFFGRGYNSKIQYSSHKELSIDSSTPVG